MSFYLRTANATRPTNAISKNAVDIRYLRELSPTSFSRPSSSDTCRICASRPDASTTVIRSVSLIVTVRTISRHFVAVMRTVSRSMVVSVKMTISPIVSVRVIVSRFTIVSVSYRHNPSRNNSSATRVRCAASSNTRRTGSQPMAEMVSSMTATFTHCDRLCLSTRA